MNTTKILAIEQENKSIFGGAIFTRCNISIDNSRFTKNYADGGGAIVVWGHIRANIRISKLLLTVTVIILQEQ